MCVTRAAEARASRMPWNLTGALGLQFGEPQAGLPEAWGEVGSKMSGAAREGTGS